MTNSERAQYLAKHCRCIRCGGKDERTLIGLALCHECAEKDKKRYYKRKGIDEPPVIENPCDPAAGQSYEQVSATVFFNFIDKYARRVLTCISENRRSVSYVNKKTKEVVGYIVMSPVEISKYYLDTNYDFNNPPCKNIVIINE